MQMNAPPPSAQGGRNDRNRAYMAVWGCAPTRIKVHCSVERARPNPYRLLV
jgi:hypothetical protein